MFPAKMSRSDCSFLLANSREELSRYMTIVSAELVIDKYVFGMSLRVSKMKLRRLFFLVVLNTACKTSTMFKYNVQGESLMPQGCIQGTVEAFWAEGWGDADGVHILFVTQGLVFV